MRKAFQILAVAALGLAAVACASAEKMAEMAESVVVTCDPAILEVVAGEINADITVTYPDGYFHPKAIVKVTPVIVYEGGEAKGATFAYQGEKVKDNFKVVSSNGDTVKEKVTIDYVPGMEKCYLELRGIVSYKKKSCNLPTKKVADGAITTYMLVDKDGFVSYKADNYQEIIKQTEEGQILYTINSADVRSAQLKGQSIKNFQNALDEINANERKTLKGTEVVAYASPDGGEKLNNKLSDKRSQSAGKAWSKVVKGHEATDPEIKSIGQDWEGFKELVSESDLEDKDLILRVLSMYSDPAVRESEIKNMSEVYKELKGEVLPELRRARFIANVEYKNYTKDELLKLVDENIDILDEEALLRVATLVKPEQKIDIYNKAVKKFNSERAKFNIGVANLELGKVKAAADAFAKCAADGDVANALGVLALRDGDLAKAANQFAKAGTNDAAANLGVTNILNGKYADAVKAFEKIEGGCCDKALAYILNNQLDKAAACLQCECPKAQYLKAVIAARSGKLADAKKAIEAAAASDDLKARALKDIEFSALR